MLVDLLTLAICLAILWIFFPIISNPSRNPPPIPSFRRHRELITKDIGHLGGGLHVLELGTGWGGLARAILKLPNVRSLTTIEMSGLLYLLALATLGREGKPVAAIHADILEPSRQAMLTNEITNADVIVFYMSGEMCDKIVSLAPSGTMIYSVLFPPNNAHRHQVTDLGGVYRILVR